MSSPVCQTLHNKPWQILGPNDVPSDMGKSRHEQALFSIPAMRPAASTPRDFIIKQD